MERLPHLSVLVGSYRLYLNQLSRAVGLAPEVRQLLRRVLELVVEGPLQMDVN